MSLIDETQKNDIILDSLIKTNASCSSGDFKPTRRIYEEDTIDWLYHHLPNLKYVVDQIVDFIFSDGLTTGDEKTDETLDAFLYKENIQGTTNYTVLREAVRSSLIFGKCGIRFLSLEDGIILVDSKEYNALTAKNTTFYGFKDIIGYILAIDEQKITEIDIKEIQLDEDEYKKKGVIVDKGRSIIIVSKEDFINLRTDTTKINGESKLKFDQMRSQLLKILYERLLYDVEYDGPGRILLEMDEQYAKGIENEISTAEVVNQTLAGKQDRMNKVKTELKELAKLIKESGSDQVIAIPPIFKKFTQLERITKAADFLSWIETNEGIIMAHIFGIQPVLIGLGKVSGNISQEASIDNAMVNSIVPMRENFAVQISNVLAPKLAVAKIYFDKYAMRQSKETTMTEMVNAVQKLKQAGYDQAADKLVNVIESQVDDGKINFKKLRDAPRRALNKLINLFNRRKKQ